MASPPFNIVETLPEDDDFAAQFPALERTYRDVVESWFLVEGNTQGRSNKRAFDWQNPAPTGVASVSTVYADVLGYLMSLQATANAQYVGVPVGCILPTGGTTADEGYLLCAGQAVSRTTYARLFARIGINFGAGDGSTTFNLPDLRGRGIVGLDNLGGTSANRITDSWADTIGGNNSVTAFTTNFTLALGHFPNVNLPFTFTGATVFSNSISADLGHSHTGGTTGSGLTQGGFDFSSRVATDVNTGVGFATISTTTSTVITAVSGFTSLQGLGTPITRMHPAQAFTMQIKF